MAIQTSYLENLISLAEETSSDKRRALLEGVTDLFFDQDVELNENEQGLASDILSRVAQEVTVEVRGQWSDRLASLEAPPAQLARQLAHDVIEVARPMLMKCTALNEADLVEIVSSHGKEHHLAVTQRPQVSAAVSDALAEHGDTDVLASLVKNAGAEISRDTMEAIVARSETAVELHRPLLARQDLPPDMMHEMFWWVGAALKRYILTNAKVDEAEVDEILADAEAAMQQAVADGTARQSQAEQTVERMATNGQLNQEALVQFLRQGSGEEFVAGMARLTGIDAATIERIIGSASREAVAVACRASGFDLSTFSAIVLLIDKGGQIGGESRSTTEVAHLLELYNKVPLETAKRAMRFWRVRKQTMRQQAARLGSAAA